jgi:hypothetical protein
MKKISVFAFVGFVCFSSFANAELDKNRQNVKFENRSFAELSPGFENDKRQWFICENNAVRYRFDFSEKAYWYKNIYLNKEEDANWVVSNEADCS